ncbi:MCE family protein [Mycolicibacterium sp. 624]|uniref:MCE family protein n=1 Tax=Mycolicibacterium sp. 624 TaxID=3156314 RepID=UPI0033960687
MQLGNTRVHPWWWTLGLVLVLALIGGTTVASFTGAFSGGVTVTLRADRAGLVLAPGSRVKMRGIDVGKVDTIKPTVGQATLRLSLDRNTVRFIPANVQARIRATTVFGAKYVDLIVPTDASSQRISDGVVVRAVNVSTEVNTVFDSLMQVLRRVQPEKLNAVLTTLADGLRGRGEEIGQATSDAADVLAALNPRMDVLRGDFTSLAEAADVYATAAPDLLATLSSVSTTSATISGQAADLTAALLATIGLAHSGQDLLEPNRDSIVRAINDLRPTTALFEKYHPEYTCTLQGAEYLIRGGAYDTAGGTDGRSTIVDVGLGFAQDPYRYPQNLPKINAKGGPDGKPGCGSLPRPDLNFPVRALVTDTGYGTGLDWRPNPGIAHPYGVNFFPVTKAVPEPPRIYGADKPPAIGPVPYPGAPPYGAPLFGPDGQPLWAPPPPGAPPPPIPGVPNPPPPYGTGQPLPGTAPSSEPGQP